MTRYGTCLDLRIYGGSHDPEIGLVCTGLPAGEPVDLEALQAFLARRAPGQNSWSTKRREPDIPVFLSGLEHGVLTGETLHSVIRNTSQRSGDYANLADIPRPSHADYPARVKYGPNVDLRGGGHFSGRLTAPLCIAGGIALQLLARRGILVSAHALAIGGVYDRAFDPLSISPEEMAALRGASFPVLSSEAGRAMQEAIEAARLAEDSVGGIVECAVTGLPAGLGEHMFAGMEGRIAGLVFAIPAVKGLEFGAGFSAAGLRGSAHNDPYYMDGDQVRTRSNHAGGILGGMTTGMPLVFRAAVKPTPSIGLEQDSVSLSRGENVKLRIQGRHDPCIVPRAVPVFEAAAALAVLDAILEEETQTNRKEE